MALGGAHRHGVLRAAVRGVRHHGFRTQAAQLRGRGVGFHSQRRIECRVFAAVGCVQARTGLGQQRDIGRAIGAGRVEQRRAMRGIDGR